MPLNKVLTPFLYLLPSLNRRYIKLAASPSQILIKSVAFRMALI
jgi:hypothetical protein